MSDAPTPYTAVLRDQVQQLLDLARTSSPDWHGEWNLQLRPETLSLLDEALMPGQLHHPTDPARYAPLDTTMFDGAEVTGLDLRWDIVMAAPGLGSGPQPACYWLDLETGEVAEWTADVYHRLCAQGGTTSGADERE